MRLEPLSSCGSPLLPLALLLVWVGTFGLVLAITSAESPDICQACGNYGQTEPGLRDGACSVITDMDGPGCLPLGEVKQLFVGVCWSRRAFPALSCWL